MADKLNRTELHYAIVDGKLDLAKKLVLSGDIDLNAQDDQGFSALHFAAKYKNIEIVKLLTCLIERM
ncbi:MAG: ankyrin repeat domain-containing protein [Agarilytica sp.]